jgi:hypothetical protein
MIFGVATYSEFLGIDEWLPNKIDAIERVSRHKFDTAEVDRLLRDSESEEQVIFDTETYEFVNDRDFKVRGEVEQYEEETIWLHFKSTLAIQAGLIPLFKAFEFAFGSGTDYREVEETLSIFRSTTKGLIDWSGGD